MLRKVLIIFVVVLLLVVATTIVYGQTSSGTIAGTVYHDQNADGVCVGTGEPGLAGVPIDFVSDDGFTISLQSGTDGTYGLVAVGFGRWRVTARPGTGFTVTSQQTIEVILSAEQSVASAVDFCVAQGTVSTGGGGAVVLPESGAAVSPSLVAVGVFGVLFLALGSMLVYRGRRAIRSSRHPR
jgi:hypothetical protein